MADIPIFGDQMALYNPRGWYRGNELSGSIIDQGFGGSDLTVQVNGGPTYGRPGPYPNDGESGALFYAPTQGSKSTTGTLSNSTGGTWGIWCKCDDFTEVTRDDYVFGQSDASPGAFMMMRFTWNVSGPRMFISGRNSAATGSFAYVIDVDITDNNYHFFVFTHDGTVGGFKAYLDGVAVTATSLVSGIATTAWWSANVQAGATRIGLGVRPSTSSTPDSDNVDLSEAFAIDGTVLTPEQILDLYNAGSTTQESESTEFFDELSNTGNLGLGGGPNHWWRMNVGTGNPQDIGVDADSGDAIAVGGDPEYQLAGPLPLDVLNAAIRFDGQGDYFEVGKNAASGALVTGATGTIGFFLSLENFTSDNIVYSQANDLATQRFNIGIRNNKAYLEIDDGTNEVTLTSSIEVTSFDYVFVTVTFDGTDYVLYINGVEDTGAVLVDAGSTGGLWFDDVTATRSALGAQADSSFTTETLGRASEVFIYDPDVINATTALSLYEAAVADGVAGVPNPAGVLVFENVTFKNGGNADVRALNALSDFNQAVMVNRCRFQGGDEGAAKQSILLQGRGIFAQVRGSTFDLAATPTSGRAAIVGTTDDPAVAPAEYSSLIVSDCTFSGMGYLEGAVVRSPVFLESAFGMSVYSSRFFDCRGSAIGWRADAQRVAVRNCLIDSVVENVGGVYVQQALNTGNGTAWQIQKNVITDLLAGAGLSIFGGNLDLTQKVTNLQVRGNRINAVAAEAILLDQVQDTTVEGNAINGGATDGIRLKTISGSVLVQGNAIRGHSGVGVILDEESTQVAALTINRNTVEGALTAGGITADGILRLVVLGNVLRRLDAGLTLGTIEGSGYLDGNVLSSVVSPLTLVSATTQTGLVFGSLNTATSSGDLETLTVASNAITASSFFHRITSASAVNLDTINGINKDGFVLLLILAAGSSDITVVEGGNIVVTDGAVANEFTMDTPGESLIALVNRGGSWYEIARNFGT